MESLPEHPQQIDRLTPYERSQIEQIQAWRARPPSILARGFDRAMGPGSRIMQGLIPVVALKAALNSANALASRMSTVERILRRADADSLGELRQRNLAACDALADGLRRRAMLTAAGTGAITGLGGAVGLALDIPALLTLSLNSIHSIGLCYGYDCMAPEQQRYAIAIFALASANSIAEKEAALAALGEPGLAPDSAAWRDGVERATQRELSKEAAVISLQSLARQLGINLGRRKGAGAVPMLGAAVGGGVNAWYLRDLCETAKRAFQARRLAEKLRGVEGA